MLYPRGSIRKVRIVSFLHMFIAVLCFVIGIVQLAEVDHWSSHMSFGLWGGIWIFVIGLLGYFSAVDNGDNNKNSCLIGTFMTFAIIGAVLSGIFLFILGIALGDFNSCIKCYDDVHKNHDLIHDDVIHKNVTYKNHRDVDSIFHCGYHSWHNYSSRFECVVGKGLMAFLLALQLFEFCLTIASSVFCCSALCCQPRSPAQVVYVPTNGGMIQLQGGAVIASQPGQGQAPVMLTTPQTQFYTQQAPPMYQPQVAAGFPNQVHQVPPPYYDGSVAAGVTVDEQNAGPLPEKSLAATA